MALCSPDIAKLNKLVRVVRAAKDLEPLSIVGGWNNLDRTLKSLEALVGGGE